MDRSTDAVCGTVSCREVENRTEARMAAFHLELEESKKEKEECIAQLKEFIVLRDEQLTAAMN